MDGKLSFWLFTNRLVNNVSAVKKGKNNYIIIDPAKDSFILTSITQLQYNVNDQTNKRLKLAEEIIFSLLTAVKVGSVKSYWFQRTKGCLNYLVE